MLRNQPDAVSGASAPSYHVRRKADKGRLLGLLLACALGFSLPAYAQPADDKKPVEVDQCANLPEMLLRLKTPSPENKLPWKKIVGVQGMERLLTAMPADPKPADPKPADPKPAPAVKDKKAEDKTAKAPAKDYLLLAGEGRGFDLRTRTPGKRVLYLTQVDGKGGEGEEIRTELPEGRLEKMVPAGSQIVAIDRQEKDGKAVFMLSKFSKQGKILSSTPLSLSDGEIAEVTALLPDGKSGALYIAFRQLAKDGTGQTVLVYLSPSGKTEWKRTYLPGSDNALYSLTKLPDGSLLGLGQMQLDRDRKAAWFVNLSANGSLLSQIPMPRGTDARLLMGKPSGGDRRLLAGTVATADEKDGVAMWVLLTTIDGSIAWQRYVASPHYNFEPVALNTLEDGRLVVIANAVPQPGNNQSRPNIRQLVFAPNGYLIGDTAYQQSAYTQASLYLPSQTADSPSLLIGNVRGGFVADDAPDTLKEAALDGLVIATPAFPAYKDPCQR